MILAIEIENFYSIREKVRIDFRAGNINSKSAHDLSDNVFEWKGQKILKSIGLFGPNASGKTNIIKAISSCCRLILESYTYNQGREFDYTPFLFGGYDQNSSSFYINFESKNIEYEYEFKINRKKVLEERLYYYPNNRKAKVFERIGNKYTFGTKGINRPTEVTTSTSSNQLFLSVASKSNRNIAKDVYLYFYQELLLSFVLLQDKNVESIFNENKKLILKALEICDSDIVNMLPYQEKGFSPIPIVKGEQLQLSLEPVDVLNFRTIHKADANISLSFSSDESNGTKQLFNILLRLADVVKNGKSIMVDEYDVSLHYNLAVFVLNLIHASEKSQLLFTSHNLALLDMNIFRKDQIVFVDKTIDGATRVYSLFDYKDFRETMDLRKAYLQGRFDAIPIVPSSVSSLKKLLSEDEE